MQGSLLSSATLALQEEESRAAFQGINNSGRQAWLASRNARCIIRAHVDKQAGQLGEQHLGDKPKRSKNLPDCSLSSCLLGKNSLSPSDLVEMLLGCPRVSK